MADPSDGQACSSEDTWQAAIQAASHAGDGPSVVAGFKKAMSDYGGPIHYLCQRVKSQAEKDACQRTLAGQFPRIDTHTYVENFPLRVTGDNEQDSGPSEVVHLSKFS